ncbi:MAG: glutamate--tRNA ligase [Eubacteriales bacterium]|nr:glutamate--tRNA ligase [Eubacteriales bacterium]
MENLKMAELLFPEITKTPEYYEELYPARNLKEGAVVTRFAPSPTGFLHFGGLFASFVGRTAAKTTGGVFFLRIEDTDKKREIENGVSLIVKGLNDFGIEIDEGMLSETVEKGEYGPYTQSARRDIYRCFVKELVKKGMAYPCFMSEEELSQIRELQEEKKELPGVWGKYAKFRDITVEEAKKRIDAGEQYVVRLRSPGQEDKRVKFKDVIRGEIEMPENIIDVVLLKKDGIPTYHFAHVVDDHLMRTTHVVRGDEWVSSVPIHLQLFNVCGFKLPKFAHISPIMKEENGGKRKLSKRKDPEAAVSFYEEEGYPAGSVWEYLLTLANSNYEEWRRANKDVSPEKFPFSFSKMSKGGALFDLVKLNDISKGYIATLSADEVYDLLYDWSKANDDVLFARLQDKEYALKVLGVERGNAKPRKDIAKWKDVRDYTEYYFTAPTSYEFSVNISKDAVLEILENYKKVYTKDLTSEDWFPAVRDMAEELGYAKNPKLYKENPDAFMGHVGDVSTVIRIAITGRSNTPDLFWISTVLGYEETISRIDNAINFLK